MEDEMEQETQNSIYKKFMDACSILPPESDPDDPEGWVHEIKDEWIWKAVGKLGALDRELITLLVFENYTQKEIGEKWGISPAAVSLR